MDERHLRRRGDVPTSAGPRQTGKGDFLKFSREYWVMKRRPLLRSELNSIVFGMIVAAVVLGSAKEGRTHERTSDRLAVVNLEQPSTSGGSRSPHHQPLLKFAQWKCSSPDELGGRDCSRGGGASRGGGGGGGAIGITVVPKLQHRP